MQSSVAWPYLTTEGQRFIEKFYVKDYCWKNL